MMLFNDLMNTSIFWTTQNLSNDENLTFCGHMVINKRKTKKKKEIENLLTFFGHLNQKARS